jgi:polyhydroxybutyrate depolymerase
MNRTKFDWSSRRPHLPRTGGALFFASVATLVLGGCVELPPPGGTGGGAGGGSGGFCSGKLGSPGETDRTIEVEGQSRRFIVHIPDDLDPSVPAPIVFVHHGFTMGGNVMIGLTGFAEVADREGFIAVFPYGEGTNPWNVGEDICGAGTVVNDRTTDDIAFVEAMIDDVNEDHCVDRDEVFLSGFSMGGYFANHVACEAGDMLRGAAAHSGGTYPGDCSGAPVPMMIIHGDADWLIAPRCGSEARDYWVERNGCSNDVDRVEVKGGYCEYSLGCDAGGDVVFCMFDGMLHGWAGAPTFGPGGFYSGGESYESATELIWGFFQDQL